MENEENKNPENENVKNENAQTGNEKQPKENAGESKNEEKTFTQKELDEIIETRLAKAKKGIPSKEELKAFNDWKESQKTEEQKREEKEKENLKVQTERDNLKRENLLLRKGVKNDDMDYVMFKVSKLEGEFEDNLETFLKDNPKYLNSFKEDEGKVINLGGEHNPTNTPDLDKMSYDEYKEYRNKNK